MALSETVSRKQRVQLLNNLNEESVDLLRPPTDSLKIDTLTIIFCEPETVVFAQQFLHTHKQHFLHTHNSTLICRHVKNVEQTVMPDFSPSLPDCPSFERSGGKCLRSPASLLTAISSHCLAALPAKVSAFNSHMRQNAWYRNLKWTLDLLPCYCDTIKTNGKTIRSQVWQPVSAGKGADMSELQAHHCMTSEQWTWLLCSVSVVPANKLSLHEINQLIGIELLTSSFIENFGS